MKAAGEAAWTNATHLVVAEPGHPRMGSFRAAPTWAGPSRPTPTRNGKTYVVRLADGTLAPHTVAAEAQLYVEDAVATPGWTARPARGRAQRPVAAARKRAARRWMSTPRSAACRRTRSPNWPGASPATEARRGRCPRRHDERRGLHTAYAIAMLNTLVGNLNVEGGLVLDAGPFRSAGPRYNIAGFANRATPKGVGLSRNRFPTRSRANSSARRRRASRPIRPPRPGIRPPADSARKCWPRRWRATRTAPRSGSTT